MRIGCPSRYIFDIIYEDMGVISLAKFLLDKASEMTMVLVNGIIAGFTDDPVQLVKTYKLYRRWYSVPIDSSISYKCRTDQVCINTDAEDTYRPLFALDKFHLFRKVFDVYKHYPTILWHRLLIEGVLEYINKEEESELLVVVTYEEYMANCKLGCPKPYTHMEIHPSFTIYGVAAGAMPFSNHNQAPRFVLVSGI